MLEWIKTGRKNNRAVLEILQKKNRDHFKHKEQNKLWKKTNKRARNNIFHNKTNIFEWIYIPYEQLVLISERTPISIPKMGNKYSMSCCYR